MLLFRYRQQSIGFHNCVIGGGCRAQHPETSAWRAPAWPGLVDYWGERRLASQWQSMSSAHSRQRDSTSRDQPVLLHVLSEQPAKARKFIRKNNRSTLPCAALGCPFRRLSQRPPVRFCREAQAGTDDVVELGRVHSQNMTLAII